MPVFAHELTHLYCIIKNLPEMLDVEGLLYEVISAEFHRAHCIIYCTKASDHNHRNIWDLPFDQAQALEAIIFPKHDVEEHYIEILRDYCGQGFSRVARIPARETR